MKIVWKRGICCVMTAVLAAGLAGCGKPSAEQAPGQNTESKTDSESETEDAMVKDSGGEIKVGSRQEGFTVTAAEYMDNLDAQVIWWRHDKTGARVVFVLNDDQERAFSIGFHTETSDSTGLPHILEHASCAASEKYPSQDVFFDTESKTYHTYINAFTTQNATTYQVASLDENQLYTLTDMYLDCCFHSLVMTEENYFKREGYHYELENKDAPLTVNGIVYNEMKGVYGDIEELAQHKTNELLFPSSHIKNEPGGLPEDISTLSYDDLKNFYQKCYQPSNSVSCFYGDLDMDRFLKLLNEDYFSKSEGTEGTPYQSVEESFTEPARGVFAFPVSADAEGTGAFLLYEAVVDEADSSCIKEKEANIISELLMNESSVLKQRLDQSGIASKYDCGITYDSGVLALVFSAQNADAGRLDEFRQIILDSVTEMCEAGFDEELVEGIFAQQNFAEALERNASNVGVAVGERIATVISCRDDQAMNPASVLKEVEASCKEGVLEAKTKEWLIDNPHAALTATVPQKGLLEQQEAENTKRLADKKAAMTEEEIGQMVADTKAFHEWNTGKTNEETLKKLQAVNADTVDVTVPSYEVKQREKDGVRILTAQTAAEGIGATRLQFDLSALSVEEIQYLDLYTSLLGLETDQTSQQEMSRKNMELLYNVTTDVSVLTENMDRTEYSPCCSVTFYAFDDQYDKAAALLVEMLQSSLLEKNKDRLLQNIDFQMEEYSMAEDLQEMIQRQVMAYGDESIRLDDAINGMDHYQFLVKAQKELQEEPELLFEKLDQIRKKAFGRKGLVVLRAGNEKTEAAVLKMIENELAVLPEGDGTEVQYTLPEIKKSVAYTGNSTVSYTARAAYLPISGVTKNGSMLVAAKAIGQDYLTAVIRFQNGAYGASNIFTSDQQYLATSYRDSGVSKTLETYDGIGEYLRNLDLTEDTLNSYKMAVYSDLLKPYGNINMAMTELDAARRGGSEYERKTSLIAEIRQCGAQEVQKVSDTIDILWEHSAQAVIAPASMLEDCRDQFDEVIPLP